jgi:hypothetical protein
MDHNIGRSFNQLTVLSVEPAKRLTYKVRCSCGNVKVLRADSLGRVQTCGRCLTFTAGDKRIGELLYRVWYSAVDRCYNEHNQAFADYGARGIRVVRSWRNDVLVFVKWALANGYAQGKQLDRKDNTRGYSPKNCRFVTPTVNCRNRRTTTLVVYKGRKIALVALVDKHSILPYNTVYMRVANGWPIERALKTPVRGAT